MHRITEIDNSIKPDLEAASAAERLDNLLASHGGFGSAIKVRSRDEQLEFIGSTDPSQMLNLVEREGMERQGKTFEVLHFENRVTGQSRSEPCTLT
jgi:hypothetical protein